MRVFAAAAAGLVLAIGAAFAITALAGPAPAGADKPLEVTAPPAAP